MDWDALGRETVETLLENLHGGVRAYTEMLVAVAAP